MKSISSFLPKPTSSPKKVVIIGGGVTGALAAFELTKSGHKVTLIEARSIGSGSSGKSAACIRQQFSTPSTVKGMIFCTQYYDQWKEIVGSSTVPIVHSGYLFLKRYQDNMDIVRATVKMQQEAGLKEVQILDAPQIDDMFPYIDTRGIKGATWCPTDGFLYPDMIFLDASQAAREAGAQIICNDEVIGVEFSGNIPVAVKTKSGKIFYADIFVNCAGAWAPKVSALFGGCDLDIKALRRYLYFVEEYPKNVDISALTGDYLENLPMVITPMGCYVRPESKGSKRLMMGWVHHANPVEPDFDSQDYVEPDFGISSLHDYGWGMRKEIQNYIYDVSNMGPTYAVQSGYYEETPDHNPLIGFDPKIRNLIHGAGFSGHGLMHAPFSGRAINHLVDAGHNLEYITLPNVGKVDLQAFLVDRQFCHGESMVI